MSRPRPTLLLRAHGGVSAGLGHVMRLVALGAAWHEAGGRAILLAPALAPQTAARLATTGIEWREQCGEVGGSADARATAAVAAETGAIWVAVDGYVFTGDFFRTLAAQCRKILVVDDHAITAAPCANVVVDPAFQANAEDYRDCARTTRLLLGPEYALLRPEFRRQAAIETAGPVRRLLVTMGGSDPDDTSSAVLRALGAVRHPPEEIVLVVGAMNPRPDRHFERAAPRRVTLTLARDVANMAGLMSTCDAAISAGGTTIQELAALGVPALLIPIADNQRAGVRYVSTQGWFTAVEAFPARDEQRLAGAIEQWLGQPEENRRRAKRAAAHVDGLGARRICAELEAA